MFINCDKFPVVSSLAPCILVHCTLCLKNDSLLSGSNFAIRPPVLITFAI